MRPEEQGAKEIIEAIRGVDLRPLDPGGGAMQLPDFEMFASGGAARLGVVEVTTNTPAARAAFSKALAQHDWMIDGVGSSWFVKLRSADVDLRVLRRRLPDVLAELHSGRIGWAEPEQWVPRAARAHTDQSLIDLGVEYARSFEGTYDGRFLVHVQPPSTCGAIGESDVNDEVGGALADAGNVAKLRTARPGEVAELFVWLPDSLGSLALQAPLVNPELRTSWPHSGPCLPAGVTSVWAATGLRAATHLAWALWYSDGSTWQVLTPPPRPPDHPWLMDAATS